MKRTSAFLRTESRRIGLNCIRRWLWPFAMVPLVVSTSYAEPTFGANCLQCHSPSTGRMELIGNDSTANPGPGEYKVYQVEAGQTAAVQLDVIDGGGNYGLSVFNKSANGVNDAGHELTIPTPGSPWNSGSDYYYIGITSANATWTLDIPVDAATPPDFYLFESQIGIKSSGRHAQAERFYIEVLSTAPENTAPVLAAIPAQTLDEGGTLNVTAEGTDADIPTQALSYSLSGEVPAGMSIDASSGAITWETTEADGPGSVTVQVTVTDDGTPALSDTKELSVTVNEVNVAPSLAAIPQQTAAPGATVVFTASGLDTDVPAQTLTYSLEAGAPAEASIGPSSGAFSWTVPVDATAGTTTIDVTVTDDGTPNLTATQSVSIVIEPQAVMRPIITATVYTGQSMEMTVATVIGHNYILEYKTSLTDTTWTELPAVVGDGTERVLSDPDPVGKQRFYRIRVD